MTIGIEMRWRNRQDIRAFPAQRNALLPVQWKAGMLLADILCMANQHSPENAVSQVLLSFVLNYLIYPASRPIGELAGCHHRLARNFSSKE